jgi:hypothetical protein
MASFKRLKRSDVISVPYVANKNWVFEYCPYPENDQNIKILKGTNLISSFSSNHDPVTQGEYERLVYSQINHLFYQQYSSSNLNLNTSSLLSSLYYDGVSQVRATSSYFNYNESQKLIKTFPTGANEGIRVLSISKNLYGEQILPYEFALSSSVYYITDDGNGNLTDSKNSNVHVGNIFYAHGLAVITNQNYQLMWPLPPLANYREVNYLDTDTSRVIPISASITLRNANDQLLTGSLELFNFDYTLFTDNNNGNTTFANVGLGTYYTNYTFDATISGSNCTDKTLTSNAGLLKVIVRNNCNFAVSFTEFIPTPTPTPTPLPATATPTATPTSIPATSTPTPTGPTATPTSTPTSTPTFTPTPGGPTFTPTATPSATPTATPTPVIVGYQLMRCDNYDTSFYTTDVVSSGQTYFSGGGLCYYSIGAIYSTSGLTQIFGTVQVCNCN